MVEYKLINDGVGRKADIYSVVNRDAEVYSEYISGLENKDRKKFVSLFDFIKELGIIKIKEKYEVITGTDVVELKILNYRILAHRTKTITKYKYIVLLGFKKPKKGTQQRKIELAKKMSLEIIAGNAIETTGGGNG